LGYESKALQAAPNGLDAGFTITLTPKKTTKRGDHKHRFF
jgi:hypothetical protein